MCRKPYAIQFYCAVQVRASDCLYYHLLFKIPVVKTDNLTQLYFQLKYLL